MKKTDNSSGQRRRHRHSPKSSAHAIKSTATVSQTAERAKSEPLSNACPCLPREFRLKNCDARNCLIVVPQCNCYSLSGKMIFLISSCPVPRMWNHKDLLSRMRKKSTVGDFPPRAENIGVSGMGMAV